MFKMQHGGPVNLRPLPHWEDCLIKEEDLASILGIATTRLKQMRSYKLGPPWLMVGDTPMYGAYGVFQWASQSCANESLFRLPKDFFEWWAALDEMREAQMIEHAT